MSKCARCARRRPLWLAAVLASMLACAHSSRAPVQGLQPPAAASVGWRALGTLSLHLPDGSATVDIALLSDRRERLRLEAMLPTGTPAVLLWLERGTWIAADPAAATAYRGTMAEVLAAAERLPVWIQAGLALGLAVNFLNLNDDFATIWNPAAVPTTAAFAGPALTLTPTAAGGLVAVGGMEPWRVTFFPPPDDAAWPQVWRVLRQAVQMEVRWHRLTALAPTEARLLQPQLPSSFVFKPLPVATAATTTSAAPLPSPLPLPRNP